MVSDRTDFGPWIESIDRAIHERSESAVPCGSCTACCESSQFIHITPDETATLAAIPKSLRFPAPGLPAGHVVLGYDEQGRCPMFVDRACSIYDVRPRACRVYDCRVLTAATVVPVDAPKRALAARAQEWRFSFASPDDAVRQAAVAAAARYLADHRSPDFPNDDTQRAVLAIAIRDTFLAVDESGTLALIEPSDEAVRTAVSKFAHGDERDARHARRSSHHEAADEPYTSQ